MRKGYAGSIQGLVPVDIIAGTFGGELFGGGNNAEMATFLIIVLAFLLSRWRSGLLPTKKTNLSMHTNTFPLILGGN